MSSTKDVIEKDIRRFHACGFVRNPAAPRVFRRREGRGNRDMDEFAARQ